MGAMPEHSEDKGIQDCICDGEDLADGGSLSFAGKTNRNLLRHLSK